MEPVQKGGSAVRGVLHTHLPLFLGSDGEVGQESAGARSLAEFLTGVVAMGTRAAAGKRPGSVACRCRTASAACTGVIRAAVEGRPSRIEWWCPVCDDSGVITGWERTRWDRSKVAVRRAKAPRSSSTKRTTSKKGRKAA